MISITFKDIIVCIMLLTMYEYYFLNKFKHFIFLSQGEFKEV